MSAQIVHLPLPPRALTSNQNVHWRVSSEPKKEYRELAAAAVAGMFDTPPSKVRLSLRFCIKGSRSVKCTHKRRAPRPGKVLKSCLKCPYGPRDESNALAAFKAGQDGIADGLGISDARKHLTLGSISIDATAGPFVVVSIEVLEGVLGMIPLPNDRPKPPHERGKQ